VIIIKDKVYNFLEKYLITSVISIIVTLLLINKYLLQYNKGIPEIDYFVVGPLKDVLLSKDGTLITIAAVFIGMYFTVFSLLGSIKIDSTFSILTKENFYKLLKYIKNAFIGSFLYLFFSLFIPVIKSQDWLLSVLIIILLLYMLLSALRFGIIIYLIFKKDISKFHDNLNNEKQKQLRFNNLLQELEVFLEKHKSDEQKNKAQKTRELLEKRKQINND